MQAVLLANDGSVTNADSGVIAQALQSEEPFWLDLVDLDATGSSWLNDPFHIHPLAVEDAEQFGQRPKIARYDDFVQLVFYGAADEEGTSIEVHVLYSKDWVITVRRGACDVVDELRAHASVWRHENVASSIMLLYRIADALVDSYFPTMASFDDRIDDLEEEILAKPTEAQLGTLFSMKRQLIAMRKLITPERDMMASLLSGASDLPGMTADAERYFRDLYDHLIRLSDLVDSYRDLLTSAVDTHLSTVSNRLNEVMKQLAIIATIFLPLSFLTGFFGQNFAFLVNHLTSWWIFILCGIGAEVAAIIVLLRMFRQRGWL